MKVSCFTRLAVTFAAFALVACGGDDLVPVNEDAGMPPPVWDDAAPAASDAVTADDVAPAPSPDASVTEPEPPEVKDGLYSSSVVGTDFDFIHSNDPDAFLCLEFKGFKYREMPDKRGGELLQKAFVFIAYFKDGTEVDMALSKDFGDEKTAETEAKRYTPRLGKLPTSLREGVKRMVVHKGDESAFSESQGLGGMFLYSENATKRISTHDLEETVFHESVHAAWDAKHAESAEWKAAQAKDAAYVTQYAAKLPEREDLAESALFAYTLLHHPGRIPAAEAKKVKAVMPNRIAFVEKLLPPGKPLTYPVGPVYACDGTGTADLVDNSFTSPE